MIKLFIYLVAIFSLTIAIANEDEEIIKNLDFYMKMEYLEFEEKYKLNQREYRKVSDKNDKSIENLFYKNALKSWRKLNAAFRPGKIHDIQRDWIYDNTLLLDDNGHTFKCPSRCPAYAPEYICDLPVTNHPREFKGVFRNLIPKINKAFMKIVYNTNETCDFVFRIKDKQEKLFDIPFYNLYHFLLELKPKNTGHWVGKWEEDTGITEDLWPYIWANVNCKMLNYKVQ